MSTKPWWDFRTTVTSNNVKNRPGPPARYPPRPVTKDNLVGEPPDLQRAIREAPSRTATRPRKETHSEHADRLMGLFRSFITPVNEREK